ncbi:MAG: hypothetical protein EOM80_06440 [Erysipelotrichia bacterium]|nr:hypothetical protein [Erysipelotrichia bacterium]
MNPEANGEISNEFFKKLNQQIVQKDNLIKLLQLQIKNLKTQIDAGSESSEQSAELKKALDEKAGEIEKLSAELDAQKEQFQEHVRQKDEQIQALNQMLEERQSSSVAEVVEDPRVAELEDLVSSLREELTEEKRAREDFQLRLSEASIEAEKHSQLQEKIDSLQAELGATGNDKQEIQALKSEIEAAREDLGQANSALEQANSELAALAEQLKAKDFELSAAGSSAEAVGEAEIQSYKTRIHELEQDILNLKNIITDKDEAIEASSSSGVSAADTEALASALKEIDSLKAQIKALSEKTSASDNLSDELDRLRQENSAIPDLNASLERLKEESGRYAETAMKVTALELEREQFVEEIERLKSLSQDASAANTYKLEIAKLNETIREREDELARLRVSIDARQDESINDPMVREEIEQLTQQVADQLLAIQNFEGMLNKTRAQVAEKDAEIESLKSKIHATAAASSNPVIPISGDSEVITSFIDFFDGLDSILGKHPIPELQALHQKLLDRLIIPNQITIMQVISDEFDSERHIATDYFRTDKFPERCIVFEVEKGYCKGDTVVKKSKVWVVQNLFACGACGAMQSNSDSRFCHLCGTKIVAPNGLPFDGLPEFEPTPTTYQRFADRMLERGMINKAKEYLQAGLVIDPDFVPLLTRLADIMSSESQFEDALRLNKRAYALKPDRKVDEKIQDLETKLNIFTQAKALKLAPEEFEKLLHLIQKQ